MNFETISKKVKQFSKDTVTEIQKLNEVRQLSSGISEEKKQLERIYAAMGKKLWQQYKESPLEGFEDEMRTIEEKYSKIDLLQDQIRRVKGVVLCPCCNTEMAATERFCSNCGNKMPEVISIPEEEAEILEGEVVEASAEDDSSEAETAKEDAGEDNGSEAETVEGDNSGEAETAKEDAAEDNGSEAETVEEDNSGEAETAKEDAAEDNSSEAETIEEDNSGEAETAKENDAEDNSGNMTVEMAESEDMTDEKASCNTACDSESNSQSE